MIYNLEDMPDEAEIYVFVAARKVTCQEAEGIRSAVDSWIAEWSAAFPTCPVSTSNLLLDGQAVFWAIDTRLRGPNGEGLTGSDLDPLFWSLDSFADRQHPPFSITNLGALIVGDEVVPFGPAWKHLIESGSMTLDTFMVRTCSVAEWRAGYLIHRLKDDPPYAEALFPDQASDSHKD